MDKEARIPTALWLDAEMRRLSALGLGVYVARKGDPDSGLVLQKISNMKGQCRLLARQRNMGGLLEWIDALPEAVSDEKIADEYIQRAMRYDPDLWVVEIEDKTMSAQLADIS